MMCHVSYGHADGHAVCREACNVVRRIDLGHVSRCMLCAGRAVACVRSVPLGRMERVREPRRASIKGRGGRIWSMVVWRSERRGWGSTGPMHWDMEHMVAGDHPAFLGLPARLRSSARNRRARKGCAVRSYTLLRSPLRHAEAVFTEAGCKPLACSLLSRKGLVGFRPHSRDWQPQQAASASASGQPSASLRLSGPGRGSAR